MYLTYEIPIHAPVKGATLLCRRFRWLDYHFNPRAREGATPSVFPFL